jgi:hypothetical protein
MTHKFHTRIVVSYASHSLLIASLLFALYAEECIDPLTHQCIPLAIWAAVLTKHSSSRHYVSYRLIAYKSKQHTHFTPLLSTQIDAVFGASNTPITHWFGLSITPLMLLQLLLLASHDEASLKGTQALMLVNLTISLHTGAEGIAWLHLTMLTRCSLIDSILNIICCLIRALHSRVVNLSYSYIFLNHNWSILPAVHTLLELKD